MRLKFRPIKRNYDPCKFAYVSTGVSPLIAGVNFLCNEIMVGKRLVGCCGVWTHEFSELATIRILARWKVDWRKYIKFNGFNSTPIAHIITPFGTNNGRNLEPIKTIKNPEW